MTTAGSDQRERPSRGRMVGSLGGTSVLSGLLIVFVFQATQPRIAENRRRALEKAVFEVIPGAVDQTAVAVGSPEEVGDTPVFAGFDGAGELVGLAIQAAGQGYQDVIRILYGYAPDRECVTAIRVLESRETPGLGDKIEKDSNFLANFDCLDVSLGVSGDALLHPIEMVKRGEKTANWQIDAITGATISSRAVARMIGQSAEELIPRIQEDLERLREEGRKRVETRESREVSEVDATGSGQGVQEERR